MNDLFGRHWNVEYVVDWPSPVIPPSGFLDAGFLERRRDCVVFSIFTVYE